MNDFLRNDPIVTISTSTIDKCAIGIIRLSGFSNLGDLYPLIGLDHKDIKPRFAHYIKLKNKDTLLDDGIMIFFPGPNSYTGENLLELQLHGNPISLKRIEKHIVDTFGFKRAMPGEFTYRAYKNKRLTLSQVEGLDLILNSNTAIGLDSGLSTLNGNLFNKYLELRDAFYQLCSSIEINIDFSEDVGEENAKELLLNAFNDLDKKIKFLFGQSRGSLNQLLKPEIAFFGETNAGKSSLFNKLLGDNRAIVSDVAGTTRDFISEYIQINESAFRLIDTAGFRETNDSIESEGIKRAEELRAKAFATVYVANPFSKSFSDLVKNFHKYDYVVLSHNDQKGFLEAIEKERIDLSDKNIYMSGLAGPIEPVRLLKTGPIGPKSENGPTEPENSQKIGPIGPDFGAGPIEPLLESINFKYLELFSKNTINIERHQSVIDDMYNNWIKIDYINNINDLGVVSHEVMSIKPFIEELIGVVAPEDILNNIFSNFCIGK